MQKRVVVLSGVGFIGTHLCLRLLEEGHQVFCIDIRDRSHSPLLRNLGPHPGLRYIYHHVLQGFGIRCDNANCRPPQGGASACPVNRQTKQHRRPT